MKSIIFVVLIIPSFVWSQEVQRLPAFVLEEDGRPDPSSLSVIDNMPPYRSQDGLDICFAFTASALYEQFKCRESGSDCKDIDPTTSPSPLSLASLAMKPLPGVRDGDMVAYETVPVTTGSNSLRTLRQFDSMKMTYADSCYPFDQFVAKRPKPEETKKLFADLKAHFDRSVTQATSACADCVQNIQNHLRDNFDQVKTIGEIQEALQKYRDDQRKTARANPTAGTKSADNKFDRFIFDMFFRSCDTRNINDFRFHTKVWPPKGSKKSKDQFKKEAVLKIQELLKDGKPASIGVCLTEKKRLNNGDCKNPHEVVISGYRKICPATGDCTNPRYSFKIQNSWGAGWQKDHKDGWVDGETFLDHADYEDEALTWLEAR